MNSQFRGIYPAAKSVLDLRKTENLLLACLQTPPE